MIKLRNPLFWIILIAILLRLVAFSFVLVNKGPEALVYGDAIGYVELAENMALGNGFVMEREGELVTEVFRSPGLPLLLAPFILLEDSAIVYGLVLLFLAGVLLPLLTYRVGTLIVGYKPALVAAALIAFEPRLIFESFVTASEMPFILFSLGGLYAILITTQKKLSPVFVLLGGVLLGYSMLIRPPFFYIFLTILLIVAVWFLFRRNKQKFVTAGVVFVGIMLVLSPWLIRNHTVTGSAVISGMGWRNVYTDYLGSVRALDNKTSFSVEKKKLKEEALVLGIDYDNPASASDLRAVTLPELWERKSTVVKLELFLLTSFFMHDGYFYTFNRFGFIPGERGESHSVSFAILSQGLEGIPVVIEELKRQYFIPLFGRGFTVGIFLLALWGAWIERRNLLVYLLVLLIGLTALISTANGLGVNARLRLPVAPFLFMLAGVSLVHLHSLYEKYHSRLIHD